MVCGGLWWFAVDCGGLSFSHTGLAGLTPRVTEVGDDNFGMLLEYNIHVS